MQTGAIAQKTGTEPAANMSQPRLVRAAHEFEGQMMKELLRPMIDSDGLTGDSDGTDTGSGGALGEFSLEALGQALSAGGGLGIANKIVHTLSGSGTGTHAGKVTGTVHGDTVMRTTQ